MKPTIEFYSYLTDAFDLFNKRLFDGELPDVIFVITRRTNIAGYFRSASWLDENDQRYHEIAVNPAYFISVSPLELNQTIVHEMTHLWQHVYGRVSRNGYHNKQWAEKMREIGLEPISKNGKGTGQNVSDKPIPNSKFEKACIELFLKGLKLMIVDGAYFSAQRLQSFNKILHDRVYKTQQIIDKMIENHDSMASEKAVCDDNAIDIVDVIDSDDHLDGCMDDAEALNEVDNDLQESDSADNTIDEPYQTIIQALWAHNSINDSLDEESHTFIIETISTPINEFYQVDKADNKGLVADLTPSRAKKARFVCPSCDSKAWGAWSLEISCIPCEQKMQLSPL